MLIFSTDTIIAELSEIEIELIVSIWPIIELKSENFKEILENSYLIYIDRKAKVGLDFQALTIYYNITNLKARSYL